MPFVAAAHARRSRSGNNPEEQSDTDKWMKERDQKVEQDIKNKPEALKNRTQEYKVIVREPKFLGIKLNRDGDEENYITIEHTKPNPYNIIQYSKLVSYKYDSTTTMLEELTGKELKDAFSPVKTHIKAIQPNNETTYVTLTFKSQKVHKPLYPYSVTITSNIIMGINITEGKDINDNDVIIITIKDSNNPYGITDGSRLVGIKYGSNYNSEFVPITYHTTAFDKFKDRKVYIKPLDETTHITLYFVSEDSQAPIKAEQQGEIAKQIAMKKAEEAAITEQEQARARRAEEKTTRREALMNPITAVTRYFNPYTKSTPVVEVKPTVQPTVQPTVEPQGGKSRKTKRHRKAKRHRKTKRHRKAKRHHKKSRHNKKTHRNKH